MEIALFVYLASVVGKIISLFHIGVFLCVVIHIFNLVSYPSMKIYKVFPILAIVLSVFAAFIPSERTMYMMAGGYAAQKVGTAIMESDIQKDMMELISTKIKEEIKKPKVDLEK